MKKSISLLLALIMLLGCLISCGNNSNDPADTTAAAADSTAEETPAYTEFPPNNVPENLKFNGTTVSFLYWSDVERPEFFVESTNGDVVNDAIYDRNQKVEGQLEVKLEWVGTPGNYNNQEAFVNKCVSSTQAGTDGNDIFCCYSLAASTIAIKGIAANMLDEELLDFNQAWWPQNLVKQCTLNNKLYFASGDISTNFLYMMYASFFNKDMYREYHNDLPEPYEYVYNKTWTLDKLIELSDGIYQDLNANNKADEGDLFGFATYSIHFDAFYNGCGLKNCEIDADGKIKISDDLYSEKTVNVLEKVNTFLYHSGSAFGSMSNAQQFRDNHLLFTTDRVYIASGTLNTELDFKYGMLPIPKYDDAQENYITTQAFPFTFYLLSNSAPHHDAAVATLQTMAYQSFCLITPMLFEQSMKARYSQAGNDAIMYDIIHNNVFFDLGRIFCSAYDNATYSLFRTAVSGDSAKGWASVTKARKKFLDNDSDIINAAFAD